MVSFKGAPFEEHHPDLRAVVRGLPVERALRGSIHCQR